MYFGNHKLHTWLIKYLPLQIFTKSKDWLQFTTILNVSRITNQSLKMGFHFLPWKIVLRALFASAKFVPSQWKYCCFILFLFFFRNKKNIKSINNNDITIHPITYHFKSIIKYNFNSLKQSSVYIFKLKPTFNF